MTTNTRIVWLCALAATAVGAVIWITSARPRRRARANVAAESAQVDEAADESFPASDPPSFSSPIGARVHSGG